MGFLTGNKNEMNNCYDKKQKLLLKCAKSTKIQTNKNSIEPMKQQFSKPASRLAVLALATLTVFTFAACGGNDDDANNMPNPVNPSNSNALSEETTPIDFEFKDYIRNSYSYCIFDYAGNTYVGNDTITKANQTVKLRQGKHHLVFVKGLHPSTRLNYSERSGFFSGLHYDPVAMTVENCGEYIHNAQDIAYGEKDLEVTEYLMAPQQVRCDNYVVARLYIQITDQPKLSELPDWNPSSSADYKVIGEFTGFPAVTSVSLKGSDYKTRSDDDFLIGIVEELYPDVNANGMPTDEIVVTIDDVETLCPLEGLNDIQLTATIKDRNGRPIATTQLPKFSLRRGCTTALQGPMFSGSTSDWIVTVTEWNK